MANHKEFTTPRANIEAIHVGSVIRLQINGVIEPENAWRANNMEAAKKFIKIYQKKIDEYAHKGYLEDNNHSILEAVAGRKGSHQQDERKQWQEQGVFLDFS